MTRACWLLLWCAGVVGAAAGQDAAPRATTTVGMPGRLEAVVLPGPELEAKPLDDRRSPVVLRVVRVDPHGTAFRYDLEYAGLAPGTHDLRDYLRRKNGTPAEGLPPLPVKVDPVLPPGQIEPNKVEIDRGPQVGGYRTLLIVLGVVWGVGLVAIVVSFFYPRRRVAPEVASRPVSLAEKLRPLVEGAVAGTLSRAELANLERALLAYWRKQLRLEATEPGEAVDTLRRHPDAGPLVARLEEWLHHPGPPAPVDVAALLAPYRDLSAETLELGADEPGKVVAR